MVLQLVLYGALILGEAAVNANLVSPILIIIVAITGICSFAIPDFSLSFAFRIYKFMFIFLGYLLGLLGIAIGLFTGLSVLANLKSFGISYFAPYSPNLGLNPNASFFQSPIWQREYRLNFLKTKRPKEEPYISRKWKFKI